MKTISSLAGLAPGPVRDAWTAREPHSCPYPAALAGGLDGSPGCSWGGGERCPRPHRASSRHTGSRAGAAPQITCFHPKPATSESAGPQTPGMWGQTQLSAAALHYWQCHGVALPCTVLQPTPTQGAAAHHPGYEACKGLFFRKGTFSRQRADVRGDKCDTYPLINPMGLAAPLLCFQHLLHRLMVRGKLVSAVVETWHRGHPSHASSSLSRVPQAPESNEVVFWLLHSCRELLQTLPVPVIISAPFVFPAVLLFPSAVFFP